MTKNNHSTVSLVQLALFGAIIVLLAFTPIGYIPLGLVKATTIHIPVIIGSIILGPKRGAILGFIFGLTSLINNTINPSLTSFVFTPFYSFGDAEGNVLSLIICFVPRILVGVVPYFVYKFFTRFLSSSSVASIFAGICGSLTNTILVMSMIYLFFGEAYSVAYSIAQSKAETMLYSAILAVVFVNSIPEAIVAAIITAFVVKAIKSSRKGIL